jgi:hypothetical protein
MDDTVLEQLIKLTRAVLLVQLQALAKPEEREKPEVVLGRAGFAAREVAELLNRNPAAVAKAMQRAGKK